MSALENFKLLRTDRFKLIQSTNDITELYDLEEDPQERRNIAAARPEVVRALSARMQARIMEGKWNR